MEIGPAELAFRDDEAALLFERLGVMVTAPERDRLLERTEGWPVAVYLAALAHGNGHAPVAERVGDHRYLVEYLGEELLDELDPDVASFLMDASCLQRMSGTLCDQVLGRRGSARLLEDLCRDNQLVIPLDDHREWYRFHQLFAEFLQAELTRRGPARRGEIHLRASDWCHAHDDPDGAITHAILGGDLDRAEALVLRWYTPVMQFGRGFARAQRWVAMFPSAEVDRRPLLMVVAGWASWAAGEPGAAMQWLLRAREALPEQRPSDAHGLGAPVGLALARAIVMPVTPAEMADEATYVYEHVSLGDGHPMACLALGAAAFMTGDEAVASRLLREGADTTLERPVTVANCLAHSAIIDVEHGRRDDATWAVSRARELGEMISEMASSALVWAMVVLVETHAGRAQEVEPVRL